MGAIMSRVFPASRAPLVLSALVSMSLIAGCSGTTQTTETVREGDPTVTTTSASPTGEAPEKPKVEGTEPTTDDTSSPTSSAEETEQTDGSETTSDSSTEPTATSTAGSGTGSGSGSAGGSQTSRPSSSRTNTPKPARPSSSAKPSSSTKPPPSTKAPTKTPKPKAPAKPGRPKPIPLTEPVPEFTYIMDCTNTAMEKRPSSFSAACGKRRVELTGVTWSGWGKTTATGRAQVAYWRGREAPDMGYAVTITVSGLADKTSGRRYTKLTIRHGQDRPEGTPKVKTYVLP